MRTSSHERSFRLRKIPFPGCHFSKTTSAMRVENSGFPLPQSTAILTKVVCNGQCFAKVDCNMPRDKGRAWSPSG